MEMGMGRMGKKAEKCGRVDRRKKMKAEVGERRVRGKDMGFSSNSEAGENGGEEI